MAIALSAFTDEGRSIDIGGDAVMVPAGTTVTLSLMLHELATNAAKYGALSVAKGTAGGAMDRRPDGLRAPWSTCTGRRTAARRCRRRPAASFGSRLLTSSAKQLGAELDLDYAVSGLRCRLRFPVPRLGSRCVARERASASASLPYAWHGVVTDNSEHRS